MNAALLTAPTHHQKFVEAKIEHIAKVTLDKRQKRAVTAMKVIPRAQAINQTQNAMYHAQLAEERVARKKQRDADYRGQVQQAVMEQ